MLLIFFISFFNIWFVENWPTWFSYIWCFQSNGPGHKFYKLTRFSIKFFFIFFPSHNLTLIFIKIKLHDFLYFFMSGFLDLITWPVGLKDWPEQAQVFYWLIIAIFLSFCMLAFCFSISHFNIWFVESWASRFFQICYFWLNDSGHKLNVSTRVDIVYFFYFLFCFHSCIGLTSIVF